MNRPGSDDRDSAPVGFDDEHLVALADVQKQIDRLHRPKKPSPDIVEVYVRNLVRMRHAEAHIAEHGVLVAAPRTGNPIENPHLKIVDKSAGILIKCARALGIG